MRGADSAVHDRVDLAGVELLVVEGETITRRERYAGRSTALERARALRDEFERLGYQIDPQNRRA